MPCWNGVFWVWTWTMGGDLAPSSGDEKIFRGPEWHFFRKKFQFSCRKFLTPFLVIGQVFLILRFFTLLNVVYDLFFTRKTISEKNSLIAPFFLLCSYFRAHPTTLLLEILGGTNAWAVPPPQILGGPSPLGLRPWSWDSWQYLYTFYMCRQYSKHLLIV